MNFGPKRLEIIIRNVLRHDFLDRAVVFLRIWGRCDISLSGSAVQGDCCLAQERRRASARVTIAGPSRFNLPLRELSVRNGPV